MIKVRVEWHHDCPSCGTQLVVDFLDDWTGSCVCPWCGFVDEARGRAVDEETRQYVLRAVNDIQETANNRIAVSG